jgi:hypothetical protein
MVTMMVSTSTFSSAAMASWICSVVTSLLLQVMEKVVDELVAVNISVTLETPRVLARESAISCC